MDSLFFQALNQYSGANSMSGGDARQAAYEMRMANKANEDAAKALRAQIGVSTWFSFFSEHL